ncbi:MAG: hypothetical protein PHF82_06015, partial [Lutispora sp.]|nr:hypothetical protein [Lutispora sp.]
MIVNNVYVRIYIVMLNKIMKLKNKTIDISDNSHYVESSVLVPIIESKNGLSLLYEIRSESLKK